VLGQTVPHATAIYLNSVSNGGRDIERVFVIGLELTSCWFDGNGILWYNRQKSKTKIKMPRSGENFFGSDSNPEDQPAGFKEETLKEAEKRNIYDPPNWEAVLHMESDIIFDEINKTTGEFGEKVSHSFPELAGYLEYLVGEEAESRLCEDRFETLNNRIKEVPDPVKRERLAAEVGCWMYALREDRVAEKVLNAQMERCNRESYQLDGESENDWLERCNTKFNVYADSYEDMLSNAYLGRGIFSKRENRTRFVVGFFKAFEYLNKHELGPAVWDYEMYKIIDSVANDSETSFITRERARHIVNKYNLDMPCPLGISNEAWEYYRETESIETLPYIRIMPKVKSNVSHILPDRRKAINSLLMSFSDADISVLVFPIDFGEPSLWEAAALNKDTIPLSTVNNVSGGLMSGGEDLFTRKGIRRHFDLKQKLDQDDLGWLAVTGVMLNSQEYLTKFLPFARKFRVEGIKMLRLTEYYDDFPRRLLELAERDPKLIGELICEMNKMDELGTDFANILKVGCADEKMAKDLSGGLYEAVKRAQRDCFSTAYHLVCQPEKAKEYLESPDFANSDFGQKLNGHRTIYSGKDVVQSIGQLNEALAYISSIWTNGIFKEIETSDKSLYVFRAKTEDGGEVRIQIRRKVAKVGRINEVFESRDGQVRLNFAYFSEYIENPDLSDSMKGISIRIDLETRFREEGDSKEHSQLVTDIGGYTQFPEGGGTVGGPLIRISEVIALGEELEGKLGNPNNLESDIQRLYHMRGGIPQYLSKEGTFTRILDEFVKKTRERRD